MRQLITYFIKYPITGNVLMVLIIIFGAMGMFSLRKTFFPESESKIILVEAVYPGASPEEIEKMIVLKIEDNVDGIIGIDRVTSKSLENIGSVTIEASKGFDPQLVLQDVKNAIDRINSFPEAMEPPSVYIRENISAAISFALSGKVELSTLKKIALGIETDLKAMEGISQVNIAGYPEEEIEISFRENDLKQFKLSFDQVNRAIKNENIDVTGGTIKTTKENLRIRGKNKKYEADEIAEIVIANIDNRLVRLKDIADVEQKWSDVPNRKFFNGAKSAVIQVNNTMHEDVSEIASKVKIYMADFNQINDIVKADLIRDSSKTVEERIELLSTNGLIGFVLVLVFLSLFLHPSLAGWVAVAIPISFAGMFILAAFYGITLNVISLFGMIIVIGILVDDGIVIAENIYQHKERGKEPVQAAIDGTMEVLPAVFSAIMTTVVAFSLFFLLDGRMGDFFPQMGFVVIGTLIFSLIEGAFILPAHVAHTVALNVDKKGFFAKLFAGLNKGVKWLGAERVLNWVRVKTYEPVLDFAIKSPGIVVLTTVCLMIITLAAMNAGVIKATVFPSIEGDNLGVSLQLQSGTNESVTTEWMDFIEEQVWLVNEDVKNEIQDGESVFIGVEKTIGPSEEAGALNIILMPTENRKISSAELTKRLKEKVGEIPGTEKLSFQATTPFGKAVSIALFSNDNIELESATQILKNEMDRLGTLKNILSSDQKGLQEVQIKLKEKAYMLGLTSFDILSEIRKGFFGMESQRLQKGVDEVKVWLRYDQQDRSSINDLENMRVRLLGKDYLLNDLVELKIERGIIAIEHLDGKRSVKVSADLLNPALDNPALIVGLLEDSVVSKIQMDYPSIKYSIEGSIREQAKTGRSAKIAGPIVLLLMMTIIILTFRSFLQTFAVFAMIPFGLIGVAWGHFLHGDQMSMFSYFGMIALIGIMVNDSLVFISMFNQKMKSGLTFKKALRDAGISRFRPIVLTSLTTIAGLAPLITETSFQAQFLVPMAIAIAYGLIIATMLTLVFLPAVLVIFNKIRFGKEWLISGNSVSSEEREPAVKELEYENMKFD